jgi:RHS repeat-associated protein
MNGLRDKGERDVMAYRMKHQKHFITCGKTNVLRTILAIFALLLCLIQPTAAAGAINVALASAGAVASASSIYGSAYPAAAVNNGDRKGVGFGSGGVWGDGTGNTYPDWVQVAFNGSQTINSVVVYTLQNAYSNPVEPSDTMTFSLYGITAFTVQGWNGSSWVTLGTVSGNNLVKRAVVFGAYTTDRIRVNVTGALAGYSRITEVEAFTATVPGAPTIGTALAGNTLATVAFTAPADSSTAAITSFTATSAPDNLTGSCGAPCTAINVSGLTNGTPYTFTVTATNAQGTGPASAASNSVIPAPVPDAPTNVAAVGGIGQATVTYAAPANDGGFAITSYMATSTPGNISGSCSAPCTSIIVGGLAGGTAYTFAVTAANATGTGIPSVASNSVTPTSVPGAPTIGAAVGGNTQATVPFTAPASNGGSAITGYTVTSLPAGGVDSNANTTSLSHIVTGLANGTAYTFTVKATNALGAGAASAASNSVTPATVPGAPTIGTATPGPGQATMTITPPANNGGAAISAYQVFSSPGVTSALCYTASSSCASMTVTGLTNGTAYTFTAKAANAKGWGPASTASNSVIPLAVPGAPTGVTAVGGNTQATVSFTPPASNGGAAITSYTATSTPGNLTGNCSAPCTSMTVTGLANGTAYTFKVKATNAVGTGAASAASNSVTPAPNVPDAPTNVTAVGGNAQATVTFTAPANNGGAAITSYTATSLPGNVSGSCGAPCTSIIVTSLTNGTEYTFTVTAANISGNSAASAVSNSVTPAPIVPDAPSIGTAVGGIGQATVNFTAPAGDGGAAITSYTATSTPGNVSGSCGAPCTSITVSGLANGTLYIFTVAATNAVGEGAASAPSNNVIPDADLGVYYIHADHLDTPRVITDTQGNKVWEWQNIDPFGNNVPNENPSGQGTFKFDLRFTNMVSDAETQTFYNFYRDCYDPASGRYCQSDPVGLYGGSFSTFAYVNSNPLSYVDPLGLGPNSRAPPPRGSVANEYYSSLLSQIRELRPEYRPPASIGNRDSDVSDAEIAILRNELANLRNPPNQCTNISASTELSVIRYTQPGETFIRYESAQPAFTHITSTGVTPNTYAAPISDGIVPVEQRVSTYNLPLPEVPRPNVFTLAPPPGTLIIGPRPVVGGTGNEVLFPHGY